MTPEQAQIAVPLLNTYAHGYLGLTAADVLVAAGKKDNDWMLIVATEPGVQGVSDFDGAKAIIDSVRPSSASLMHFIVFIPGLVSAIADRAVGY